MSTTIEATGPDTRVREHVVADTKTVEVEEHKCPNCGQWYEDEAVVDITIGYRDVADDPDYRTMLCTNCVSVVFGYEVPTTVRGAVLEAARQLGWRELATVWIGLASALIAIGAAVAMVGYGVSSFVHAAMAMAATSQAPSSEAAAASAENAAGAAVAAGVVFGVAMAVLWAAVTGLEDDDGGDDA